MPLSRARDRARKQASVAQAKTGGLALVPKALAKRLSKAGIDICRYITAVPVSLDDYRDLERRLAAKAARVEWQSSAIARLHALLAAQPAMQDEAIQVRLARLETEVALTSAVLGGGSTEDAKEQPPEREVSAAEGRAVRALEGEEARRRSFEATKRLAHALHPEWRR